MFTTTAVAASAATGPFVTTTVQRRELGPGDVLIDIAYCGICHSDIHTVRGEWGPQQYPLVPGHEFAGTVSAIGPEVTKHAVGDRVGVGCMVNSCGECENCRAGQEQYCLKGNVLTYGSVDRDGTTTQGGYSQQVVVDQDFVLHVPDGLGLAEAAPLLCAGITTYSPLARWGAGPGKRVAVIGMGGLGHLGVKIAAAMGAEVTVLSRSLSKKDDGLKFGAADYRATSDEQTFEELAGRFDLIINTVSGHVDLGAYLGLLRLDGVFVTLGAAVGHDIEFPTGAIAANRRVYTYSLIGGIAETQQMLDFCAEHGVAPEIETVAADQVGEAYDRVVSSDVRYRFVIDTATIGA
ncbi:NAD(P)-dependent alcohol dehydrogenase [Promicromonospora soli]